MKFFKFLIIAVFLVASFSACGGGRTPSAKTARSASLSYFKRYGKKYPSTIYGHKNVSNVTINAIEEVSYKFALADTIIEFVDGHAARALVKMENKFPTGWKVVSWETAGYR